MHIVVCLEDCNGIMFNKRRVSSDKILISKIIEMTQNKNLWVSEYSKELFVDKELRNTYGTRGLEWSKNFDREIIWKELHKIYQS